MPDTNDLERPTLSSHPDLFAPSGAAVRRDFIPLPPDSSLLKRFFYRCFLPSRRDPRKMKRVCVSSLIAYFFNGGTPVPHKVRDVSGSGIYLHTNERWSVGTILRLTLADSRQPTPTNALTVNATVIHCGEDGMGLKFVLHNPKEQKRDWSVGLEAVETSEPQIRQFLDLIRK